MAVAGQGSYTYSAGSTIAKIASDAGLSMRIQPFSGTSAYLPALNANEIDFGLANELETSQAVQGIDIYKDKPNPKLRAVAVMVPFYAAMFVRKDSDIKTIADLKGKRVPSEYTSARTLVQLIEGFLANGGISYNDVQKVPVPSVPAGADLFAEGKADTFMFALGSGKVAETAAKVGGLRALPISDDPAAVKRLRDVVPVAYPTLVQPGKGRVGIDEPTMLYAYDYLVVAGEGATDDAVYKLVKAMHDNKAALAAGFPPLAGFDPGRMAKELRGIEWHPGAIKYYKEIGAWPPAKSGT
jgi:TRAP transporter TAXI family solute receptor